MSGFMKAQGVALGLFFIVLMKHLGCQLGILRFFSGKLRKNFQSPNDFLSRSILGSEMNSPAPKRFAL
jgi:hypothetical protein